MAFERRTEHLRYRYGICLNDDCPCCKDKSVLQIVARKEFVCPECGKTLREVAPPKQPSYAWVKWLIAVLLLAGAGMCYYHFFGNTEEQLIEPSQDEIATDTLEETIPITEDSLQQEAPATDEGEDITATVEDESSSSQYTAPQPKENAIYAPREPRNNIKLPPKEETIRDGASNGPHLSWGVYSGPANGLGGVIRVTAAHTLDCRDGSSIQLQPGDEIQQTKFQGDDLRQGVWISNGERQFFTR